MGKNTLNLTLSLDVDIIAAFKAEAAEHTSEQALANHIITARYAKPGWPDLAESQVLAREAEKLTDLVEQLTRALRAAQGERDRARDHAILHLTANDIITAEIEALVLSRAIVISHRGTRALQALGVKL